MKYNDSYKRRGIEEYLIVELLSIKNKILFFN